jgi:hypothetical protein
LRYPARPAGGDRKTLSPGLTDLFTFPTAFPSPSPLTPRLTGWMATVIKLNGKKLLPSNRAALRIMLPLLAWAAAVVAVFGVSVVQLKGLQAPLSSLNGGFRRRGGSEGAGRTPRKSPA